VFGCRSFSWGLACGFVCVCVCVWVWTVQAVLMNDCITAVTLHVTIIQFSLIQLNCLTAPIKLTTDKH